MDRHTCRIVVIRVLYQLDINKQFNIEDEALDSAIAYAIDPLNEKELPLNLEEYSCSESEYNFIKDTIININKNKADIDILITRNLENYTLSRINYVDRAIIRLAAYELQLGSVAHNIIIDEALELTKEYSNLDDGLQTKFNNRLLDKIHQDLINDK
jgi:N utilization substance protein B